jgi:hypothetical protein
MWSELERFTEVTTEEINEIRIRFGLGVLEVPPITVEDEEEVVESEIEIAVEEYLEEDEELDPTESPIVARQKRKIQKSEDEKLYEFKCHVCRQEFPKMLLLSAHCKTEHQTLPQVLCWCGTALSSWKRLMAHKAKHIKESGDFNCSDCGSSYKTKSAFEKHQEMKHGPNAVKFICAQCGKEFKEKQILKNHERTHLPDELKLKHPCTICGKKFVNNHCLKIHIARIHEKVALHTCELCGKGCITKSDLNWHKDSHTQERNFECDICQLKFKSTNSLRLHKRRHFNHDKIITCPICSKEFHSPAALSNHKLVHSNIKRYKCFCGNEYKRLESYKCHLSVHTGSRPFSCQWCSRTFVNSANCRKHKLKDHPKEVAEHEAIHGKKGVALAAKIVGN